MYLNWLCRLNFISYSWINNNMFVDFWYVMLVSKSWFNLNLRIRSVSVFTTFKAVVAEKHRIIKRNIKISISIRYLMHNYIMWMKKTSYHQQLYVNLIFLIFIFINFFKKKNFLQFCLLLIFTVELWNVKKHIITIIETLLLYSQTKMNCNRRRTF